MSRMRDRMELAGLAHRRYPYMELPLAMMRFESDRRCAGLGSLDADRRRGPKFSGVRNYKLLTERGRVLYHLIRHTPAGWKYPRVDMDTFCPTTNYAEATIKLVPVPERSEHLCVPADHSDLFEQSGRRVIAAMLKEARRQLKEPT